MFVMVLNDGETYTALGGCRIVWLSDDLADDDEVDGFVKSASGEHNPGKVATVRVFGQTPERVDFNVREEQ